MNLGKILSTYPKASSLIISMSSFCLTGMLYGYYYEETEAFFTALLSGVFTSGMVYDSLYHMAYLGGLAWFYSHLSALFPNLFVIDIFEYLILIISFATILFVLIQSSVRISSLYLILFIAISVEYFQMLNHSRVSVLACIAAAALLMDAINHKKELKSLQGVWMFVLWMIGLLTRVETALFSLCLLPLLVTYLFSEYRFRVKTQYYLMMSAYVTSTALFVLFISIRSNFSEEFYLQIDPKYEAEIMFKENVIPISEMKTGVDSLRYTAIVMGFWGDSKVNDVEFLERIVNKEKEGLFYLKDLSLYKILIGKFVKRYSLYLISFFLVSFFVLLLQRIRNWPLIIGLLISQLSIVALVIFIAMQIRIADRITVSMLTGSLMLQIIIASMCSRKNVSELSRLPFIGLSSLLIFTHCYNLSASNRKEMHQAYVSLESNKEFQKAQTVVLSEGSLKDIMKTFQPFHPFSVIEGKRLFLLDNLAMTNIEPYQSYLKSELNYEESGSYPELFSAIKSYDSEAYYFWSQERLNFMKRYLKEVHELDFDW